MKSPNRWWEQAACLDSGVDFLRHTIDTETLCNACPVRIDCLDAAMKEEKGEPRDQRFMVRGGLDGNQRHRLALLEGTSAKVKFSKASRPIEAGVNCIDCGANLITQNRWTGATQAQRDVWRQQGHRRAGGGGRCLSDYKKFRRSDPAYYEKDKAIRRASTAKRRKADREVAA